MTDDYIRKEDAINCIERMTWYHVNGRGQLVDGATSDTGLYKAKDVYKGLHGIPAADVVQVVRCKDCKHFYFADNRIPQEQRYVCEISGEIWKPDSFCSYGKREE